MTNVTDAERGEIAVLRERLREELMLLWDDLGREHDRANRGCWSIACEGLGDRIKAITELVGPVDWGTIGCRRLTSGWFAQANALIGIENPHLPTDGEMRKVQESLDRQTAWVTAWYIEGMR